MSLIKSVLVFKKLRNCVFIYAVGVINLQALPVLSLNLSWHHFRNYTSKLMIHCENDKYDNRNGAV